MATSRNKAATIRARDWLSFSQPESFRELAWRLNTTLGLAAMFFLAFLLRILLAPHFGFYEDLHTFRTWAQELRQVGPHRFYATDQHANYPPGYLYILWLTGWISAVPSY